MAVPSFSNFVAGRNSTPSSGTGFTPRTNNVPSFSSFVGARPIRNIEPEEPSVGFGTTLLNAIGRMGPFLKDTGNILFSREPEPEPIRSEAPPMASIVPRGTRPGLTDDQLGNIDRARSFKPINTILGGFGKGVSQALQTGLGELESAIRIPILLDPTKSFEEKRKFIQAPLITQGKSGRQTITGAAAPGLETLSGSLSFGHYQPDLTRFGDDWKNQATEVIGRIGGDIVAFNAVGAGIAKMGASIPSIVSFASKFPKTAKILNQGLTFATHGQITQQDNATIADRTKAFTKDFLVGGATGVAGQLKKGLDYPAVFGIGYGVAKLDGASDKDALISGALFTALHGTFKAFGTFHQPTTQRQEAIKTMNELGKGYGIKIPSNPEASDVTSAYKNLSKLYHPDVKGEAGTAQSAMLNTAKDILVTKSGTLRQPNDETFGQELKRLYDSITGKGPLKLPSGTGATVAPPFSQQVESVVEQSRHQQEINQALKYNPGDGKVLSQDFIDNVINDLKPQAHAFVKDPKMQNSIVQSLEPLRQGKYSTIGQLIEAVNEALPLNTDPQTRALIIGQPFMKSMGLIDPDTSIDYQKKIFAVDKPIQPTTITPKVQVTTVTPEVKVTTPSAAMQPKATGKAIAQTPTETKPSTPSSVQNIIQSEYEQNKTILAALQQSAPQEAERLIQNMSNRVSEKLSNTPAFITSEAQQELPKIFTQLNKTGSIDQTALQKLTTPRTTPPQTTIPEQPIVEKVEPQIQQQTAPSLVSAAKGSQPIGAYETREAVPGRQDHDFKLYHQVQSLVEKYAERIGQGYTPRGTRGAFFHNTKNIRITGMNDLSVAAHEISHYLDKTDTSFTKNFLAGTKEDSSLRKVMTDFYTQYYPQGKATHPLETRMTEGFATLLQKYVESPATVTHQYPRLVKAILMPGGKYYKPIYGEIIDDLHRVVGNYQQLNALDKIGARMSSGELANNKKSFLNLAERAHYEAADANYPIEKLAKLSGTKGTINDPSLYSEFYNNFGGRIVAHNLTSPKEGYVGYTGSRDGFQKILPYNWASLQQDLDEDGISYQFAQFLIARRNYFMFQEVERLKAEKMYEQASALEKVLKNDQMTEQEVTEAYLQNTDRFKKYAEQFDRLTSEDLKLMHHKDVQLLDDEDFKKLSDVEGYAPFKREFYDDILGDVTKQTIQPKTVGGTKVSSMIRRKGSVKPIVNPVYSAMRAHHEVMKKAMKQVVYNKIAGLSSQFPDLFQPLPVQTAVDGTGRPYYPQEKDKNIIMARKDYKRYPILTDRFIKNSIDDVLNTDNIQAFERFLMSTARIFTKGTTGAFVGFALTNAAIDQITATANSVHRFVPIYTSLNTLLKTAMNQRGENYKYAKEYMFLGGERQTMAGAQNLSTKEFEQFIKQERNGIDKALGVIEKGANILSIPGQTSEIMTRMTEYINSRKKGKTQLAALRDSGQVTIPFHKTGHLFGSKALKLTIKNIPYFNPSLQAMDKALRAGVFEKGNRPKFWFVLALLTAGMIGSLEWLLQSGSKDQKDSYADKEPGDLARYIYLPNPNGKDLVRIRIPENMSQLGTVINMMIAEKALKTNYTTMDYVKAVTASIPSQLNPLEPARMVLSWLPQALKPATMVAVNKKDFPRVQDLVSQGMSYMPPEQQSTKSTSVVAKKIGELFHISPIKVDYLLTGYLGRASGYLTGKPGVYNPLSSVNQPYYFTSGRRMQNYYKLREEDQQEYHLYYQKLKRFTPSEISAIKRRHDVVLDTDKLLKDYRELDVDDDKNEKKLSRLRAEILENIDKATGFSEKQNAAPKQTDRSLLDYSSL